MHSVFFTRRSIAWWIATASITPIVASHAQLAIPEIPFRPQGLSTRPLLATEGAFHLDEAVDRRLASVPVTAKYPVDTIQATVTAAAKEWLPRVTAPIQGIQQDAGIRLLVSAGEIPRAEALIAERIANPKLSREDKALTYLSAIQAFGHQAFPDRLPIAESYRGKLDAMGDSVATSRHQARTYLIRVYYQLGRNADIRRLGAEMVALTPKMPFNDRGAMFLTGSAGSEAYDTYVAALSREKDASEQIAKVNAVLDAATQAPPEWLALDREYAQLARYYQADFGQRKEAAALLGKAAQPLVAHVWLHRDSKDSVFALNNGKIHIVELANTSCAGCMVALQMIQRVTKPLSNVEAVFLTYTYGFWANRFVDADTEAGLITKFIEERAKITIPAGIWKSKLVKNEDDGQSIESRGPNWDHYPTGKMSVWIIDGRGIIRRHFDELDPTAEAELVRTITYLQREAESDATASNHAQ